MNGKQLFEEYKKEVSQPDCNYPSAKYIGIFDLILSREDTVKYYSQGLLLFRARNNKGRVFKKKSELGLNKEPASPNRASPSGIAFIYLASSPETALREKKAEIYDGSVVATYKTKKTLKFVRLGSFASSSRTNEDELDVITLNNFILELSNSFSTPTKESEAQTEYRPAQFFAQYCKSKGFDGIIYVSSTVGLKKEYSFETKVDPHNVVLFDDSCLSLIEAYNYTVKGTPFAVQKGDEVFLEDDGEM